MFKEQKQYLIISLFISSLMIFLFNIVSGITVQRAPEYIKLTMGVFLIINVFTLIVHLLIKSINTYKISFITLMIFLVLNLTILSEIIGFGIDKYEMSKIDKMNTCEKATVQFYEDLRNDELKYFLFGITPNENSMNKLRDKYNLKTYYMGCIFTPSYECYNKLVAKHFNNLSNEETSKF